MNKPNENYYYIAGPGFNEDQLKVIKNIEQSLNGKFNYFSPFTHGGTLKLIPDDIELSKLSVKLLYDENIEQLNKSNKLIAVCNPLDKGTLFEIGYFLGSKYVTWQEYSENILLYNDINGNVSGLIDQAVSIVKSILESGLTFFVIDISNKDYLSYIVMGMCRALNIMVITWSNKPLEHNLMTACATTYHYQYDPDGLNYLDDTPEKLMYDLVINKDTRSRIFGKESCNLSNMKFGSKME